MAGFQISSEESGLLKRTPIHSLNFTSIRILEENLNVDGKMVELSDGYKVCDNYTGKTSNDLMSIIEASIHSNEVNVKCKTSHGIAEQDCFTPGEIKDLMQFPSPTKELMNEMADRNRTVGDIYRYLNNMGRVDVTRKSLNNWVKDCRVYEKTRAKAEETKEDVQEQCTETDVHLRQLEGNPGTEKQYDYDVIICYAYPDLPIAKKLIRRVENQGFRVFVPGRDDLPGEAKYVLTAYVIEKRCRRVIIMLTRAFNSSPECDFQLRFSNALDPGAREMKIIPVICEKNVTVPRFLNFIHTCDITQNEWQSLYKALLHEPYCQNTKVLQELKYPSPPPNKHVVRELKKEQNVGERHQPDGDSGAVSDSLPPGCGDSATVSGSLPPDSGDSGVICYRRIPDDGESGVICDSRVLDDDDSKVKCHSRPEDGGELRRNYNSRYQDDGDFGLSYLFSRVYTFFTRFVR